MEYGEHQPRRTPSGPFIGVSVDRVDPSTGNILTTTPTSTFWTALAFDPSTGLLFGGTGSGNDLSSVSGDIVSIDPGTGNIVGHVSTTGLNFVGDLDFRLGALTGGFDDRRLRPGCNFVRSSKAVPCPS